MKWNNVSLKELGQTAQSVLKEVTPGSVITLVGELGAGKTTFVRSIVDIICPDKSVKPRVTSPSFVIHQSYPELSPPIEHFDLYRLEQVEQDQLAHIGFFDALERTQESQGLLFLEWPEKLKDPTLIQASFSLAIQIESENVRHFELNFVKNT